MKGLKILLLTLTVVLSACSSTGDDTPVTDRTGTLVGTWRFIAYTVEGSTLTIVSADGATTSTFNGEGYDFNSTIFFGENPPNYSRSGNFTLDLFITNSDGQTSLSQGIILTSENGTWSLEDNRITLTDGDDVLEGTILELTNNRLRYQISSNRDEVDGQTSTSTNILERFTFERLN